jgi:hypothetical protein
MHIVEEAANPASQTLGSDIRYWWLKGGGSACIKGTQAREFPSLVFSINPGYKVMTVYNFEKKFKLADKNKMLHKFSALTHSALKR